MSSIGSEKESEQQPLLEHEAADIVISGSRWSSLRRFLYAVVLVGVAVVIVLLIALPLSLVTSPEVVALNGTADGNGTTADDFVTTDEPGTTEVISFADSTTEVNAFADGTTEEAVDLIEAQGGLDTALEVMDLAQSVQIQAEERLPPALPAESFNVCDDQQFKCKWVTGEGEIMDEATLRQRTLWLEVAATASVTEEGHQTAAEIVRNVLANVPRELFTALVPTGKAGVHSSQDKPTVFPEYKAFRDTPECQGRCDAECSGTCFTAGKKFDGLSGIGKVRGCEVETNVLCMDQDPNSGLENGLVHEFSHTIHKYGLPYVPGDWWAKILAAYDAAKEKRTWDLSSNAMSSYEEYWAKGSLVFFNVIQSDITGGMNSCGKLAGDTCSCPEESRAWLSLKDPALFEALLYAYGNSSNNLNTCMTAPNNEDCEL